MNKWYKDRDFPEVKASNSDIVAVILNPKQLERVIKEHNELIDIIWDLKEQLLTVKDIEMDKIQIDKAVLDLVPEEFKNLPDVEYRLTKLESTRENSYIPVGIIQSGHTRIVDLYGLPAIRVQRGITGYLRTSPIVEVIDSADDLITFRTQGGIYKLERLAYEEES